MENPKEEPKQETITYSEALKKEERIFNAKMTKEFWNTKQEKTNKIMKIKKLETRKNWVCEVNGHSYIRTELEFRNYKPIVIIWYLNEDGTQDYEPLTDEQLEKLFWENNIKTNNPVLVELPLNKEVKNTFNDQDMINFLQSVFGMEGFDYEKALETFKKK